MKSPWSLFVALVFGVVLIFARLSGGCTGRTLASAVLDGTRCSAPSWCENDRAALRSVAQSVTAGEGAGLEMTPAEVKTFTDCVVEKTVSRFPGGPAEFAAHEKMWKGSGSAMWQVSDACVRPLREPIESAREWSPKSKWLLATQCPQTAMATWARAPEEIPALCGCLAESAAKLFSSPAEFRQTIAIQDPKAFTKQQIERLQAWRAACEPHAP